ncbi:MAG: hypothetical protein IJS40_05350 [Synergistaceae bacterium]|nr:hypothetical protein [Synergistaceae bacterium]
MSKDESKNKRTFLAILSILLSFAVGVMASSYYVQVSQTYTSSFRVAKIGYYDGDKYIIGDFEIEFGGNPHDNEPILDGQTIDLGTFIQDKGTLDAFVFIKIDDIPSCFQINGPDSANWKKVDDYHFVYYYYNKNLVENCSRLPKNEKVNFINNVTFEASTLQAGKNYKLEVKMTAYAIQAYGLEDKTAKDIWETCINKD